MTQYELRLGNVLSYRGETECIVDSLGGNGFATTKNDDFGFLYGSDDVGEYEPMPLTEDWLVKFGFKRELDGKFFIGFNYGAYSMKKVGDGHDHWYFNHEFDKTKRITSNIRYVHQLQNLYHILTGEELLL